jgi:hypothetical protein
LVGFGSFSPRILSSLRCEGSLVSKKQISLVAIFTLMVGFHASVTRWFCLIALVKNVSDFSAQRHSSLWDKTESGRIAAGRSRSSRWASHLNLSSSTRLTSFARASTIRHRWSVSGIVWKKASVVFEYSQQRRYNSSRMIGVAGSGGASTVTQLVPRSETRHQRASSLTSVSSFLLDRGRNRVGD